MINLIIEYFDENNNGIDTYIAETELQNYLAPELIQADIVDGNNFLFNAGKTAANNISYADIVADVGGDGNILADVSVANQKKNLKVYNFS